MRFFFDMGESLRMEYMTDPHKMRHWHVHPQYEMYFCPQGISQCSLVNGQEFVYDYPCVILSAPYSIHSMSPTDEVAFERIVAYFGERTLGAVDKRLLPEELLSHKMGMMLRLTPSDASVLRRTLSPALETSAVLSEAERELYLLLFLHKLMARVPQERRMSIGTSDYYIQSVLRYIYEHIAEPMDSDCIASAFAVSRSKLDRDFRKCTGGTVHEFINACRLNHAKIMLSETSREKSIARIASDCGFVSETYFFAFFKKQTGMSPKEYRCTAHARRTSSEEKPGGCCP